MGAPSFTPDAIAAREPYLLYRNSITAGETLNFGHDELERSVVLEGIDVTFITPGIGAVGIRFFVGAGAVWYGDGAPGDTLKTYYRFWRGWREITAGELQGVTMDGPVGSSAGIVLWGSVYGALFA